VDVPALSAMVGKQASVIIAVMIARRIALEARYDRTWQRIFID
jgi:hypothetical protein